MRRFIQFNKAIDGYLKLYNEYPDSKDRMAALFNASQLLEAVQRYREAAKYYNLYSVKFKDEADAPEMAFKSATMYQRMNDQKGLIDQLNRFIYSVRKKPDQSERVVQAYLRIFRAWEDRENMKLANRALGSCVAAYDKAKLKPEDYAAAQAAGECQFRQVEQRYARFAKAKFAPKGKGTKFQKSMQTELEKLAKMQDALKKAYTEVIVKYQWAEWITASLFRLGTLDEQFAEKLLTAPCPTAIKREFGEEGCFEYKFSLEEMIAPIMDRAIVSFETAADKAAELRVVNAWTKLAMEKVCEFSPPKCRSLKEARGKLIVDSNAPKGLLSGDGETFLEGGPPPAPVVIDVQPRKVAPGGTLIIVGKELGNDASSTEVTLGSVLLLVSEVTPEKLVVSIPAGIVPGPLTVKTPGGTVTTPFPIEIGEVAPSIGAPTGPGAPAADDPAGPARGAGISAPAAGGGSP